MSAKTAASSWRSPGLWRTAKLVAVALLLSGCAARNAYKEGQLLLDQGQPAEAAVRLEEAVRLQPGSAEYRLGLGHARSAIMRGLMSSANQALEQGRLAEAERDYGLALAQTPGDSAALSGLRRVDAARRQDKWLQEADTAMRAQDMELARSRLRAILQEQPDHVAARRLLKRLEPAQAPRPSESLLADAYQKPISIEFKDTPLKTIFEVLSRSSGLNFLFDKDVKTDQKASIFLKNSTVEAAVNLTLLTNQLEQRILDANTVLIYPGTQSKLKDYQPLVVRSFYLANAEAKSVSTTIKTILKSRDVIVDDKLNLLIMRDTPEAIRMAEKLVALHDVPDAEVMLEVEILEVKRTRLLDLGVRWPDQATLTPLPAASGGGLTVAQLRNLNESSVGVAVGGVSIQAKKQDTDANILANPRIRVRNKEKAKILIGEKVPNITTTATSTGFVSDSVTYVDVGLKLDVEPTITLDGEVAIKVALEVSNIVNQVQTKSGTLAYQIGTRMAQTVLRLRDGENQVLAGLINDEDRRSAYKVPGFGEVPVVGRLFGSQADDGSKTEIVLSITPRIIRGLQRPSAEILEFDSGTESNLASRVLIGLATSTRPAGATAGTAPVAQAAAPTAVPATMLPPPPASASETGASSDLTAASSGAKLSWSGPTEARPGQRVNLILMLDSPSAVNTVPLAIAVDPKLLKVVQVEEGAFLRQDGGQARLSHTTDDKGRTMVVLSRAEGQARGQGELLMVTADVVSTSEGDARLEVISASPVGEGGVQVPARLPEAHVLHIKP